MLRICIFLVLSGCQAWMPRQGSVGIQSQVVRSSLREAKRMQVPLWAASYPEWGCRLHG